MSIAPPPEVAGGSEACSPPARIWGSSWPRYVFPGIWLVYLGQTVSGVSKHSSGVAAVAGYVIIAVFAVAYLLALPSSWRKDRRLFWSLYAITVALMVAECFFARADAFVFATYIAVLTVAARAQWSLSANATLGVATTFLPAALPGWGGEPLWTNGLTVLLVSFAMYGFFHIIEANRDLAAARAEVARLAAENERSRIARDLHDLLGHSLTTITVKAGLARRLAERGDSARSFTEISEVEQLSRRTLGDVRAAVAGHREVTLAGELATARQVLRAAAIMAELPGSVEIVDCELSELFGWVLREGVTNIVRHSHAPTCRVTLGPRWIEIADSGQGSSPGLGNGLTGLRERVTAVGGTLTAAAGGFGGFRLRAEVPLPATPTDEGVPASSESRSAARTTA